MSGSIGVSPSHRSSVLRGVELEQPGHPKHCHHDHRDDAGHGQQEGHHQDPGRVGLLFRFRLKKDRFKLKGFGHMLTLNDDVIVVQLIVGHQQASE